MGCCYSFLFPEQDHGNEERRPLMSYSNKENQISEQTKSNLKSYETISADAHKVFLNSSTRRVILDSDNEELKSKMLAASVDDSVLSKLSPPPSKGSISPNRIIEILSEPVTVNSTYDKLADELGGIVAKYALNLRTDDAALPVVAAFK